MPRIKKPKKKTNNTKEAHHSFLERLLPVVYREPVYPTTSSTSSTPGSKSWDSGLKLLEGCPLIANVVYSIYIPLSLVEVARLAARRLSGEWLLYMDYVEPEEGVVIVAPRYCVPRQRATTASVEVLDSSCQHYEVAVHRHPVSVKEFSGVDLENIVANNDVNILVVGDRVEKAVVRRRLPCGHYGLYGAEIHVYYDRMWRQRAEAVVGELEEKNQAETPRYTRYRGYRDDGLLPGEGVEGLEEIEREIEDSIMRDLGYYSYM